MRSPLEGLTEGEEAAEETGGFLQDFAAGF